MTRGGHKRSGGELVTPSQRQARPYRSRMLLANRSLGLNCRQGTGRALARGYPNGKRHCMSPGTAPWRYIERALNCIQSLYNCHAILRLWVAAMSPLPLTHLTLRLSSPSFLETILTHDGHPCYSTETYENSTSLSRCDPVRGLVLVANIRWPEHETSKGKSKEPPVPKVMMDGWLKSEDDLLRRNCLNTYDSPPPHVFHKLTCHSSSRKFYVPGHSHSLKWKRVQGVFQVCILSSFTTPPSDSLCTTVCNILWHTSRRVRTGPLDCARAPEHLRAITSWAP